MSAFDFGRLLGSIFIAAIPTAFICFYVSKKKFNNKYIGIFGAISCFLMGFAGGLLFALPTLGIFLGIGKFFFTNSPTEEVATESNVISLEKLHDLKIKGIISEDEFQEKKKKFMAS